MKELLHGLKKKRSRKRKNVSEKGNKTGSGKTKKCKHWSHTELTFNPRSGTSLM